MFKGRGQGDVRWMGLFCLHLLEIQPINPQVAHFVFGGVVRALNHTVPLSANWWGSRATQYNLLRTWNHHPESILDSTITGK